MAAGNKAGPPEKRQDDLSLPLITFENWKKSTLQLLQKEIQDRKTEALPSALSNSHCCQHTGAFS